jgi:replicative DNA helicase
MSNNNYTNIELERRVLSHFIRFDNSIGLKKEFLTMDEAKDLFDFAAKYKGFSDDYDSWKNLWSNDLELKHKNAEKAEKFLQLLWTEDEIDKEDIDIYIEQLGNFAEARMLHQVYVKSIELFTNGSPGEARKVLKDGLNALESQFDNEVISRGDYVEGFAERFEQYEYKKNSEEVGRVPTGIAPLDEQIQGVATASLNFLQGESNVGKTFILQEIAYQDMLHGYKVLFITVEMQKVEIEQRWDGRITNIPYNKFGFGTLTPDEEGLWKKRIGDLEIAYRQGGRLATTFIPEGCTVMAIKTEIDHWLGKWGTKPDVVVIDYADLMNSSRKTYSEQESQGAVFRDLKRLSQTENIVVWTASQISGASYGKIQITLSDTGYSKRKGNWANLVLGVSTDPDNPQILHVFVAKNTFGKKFFEVLLYTDFEKARIDTYSNKNGNGNKNNEM